MKKILIALLVCFSFVTANAKDYSKYYQNLPVQMQQPTLPSIPDNHVSILECGGNGDGLTMNTQAFAKAISKLNKMGGGHLNVPAGIYLTGLISLKDNIDLHLEKNAIIVLSEDKNDHFKIDKTTGKKESRATPAINASKRKNISITGEGTIDGNGEWWRPVKRSKVSDVEWKEFQTMGGTLNEKGDIWYPFNLKHKPNVAENMDEQEKTRTHMIRFTSCENVLVQGVTLLNSPKFHIIPTRCKNVVIDGITVKCPWNAQNGDASHGARDRTDFARGDGRKALAFMAHGGEKNHHVMHRAAENAADKNPQRAGQVAELGGQHGAHKRPGGGDGRKVVAVQNVFVGFHIVMTIGKTHSRRRAVAIKTQDFIC